jgi:hypothetical protein
MFDFFTIFVGAVLAFDLALKEVDKKKDDLLRIKQLVNDLQTQVENVIVISSTPRFSNSLSICLCS